VCWVWGAVSDGWWVVAEIRPIRSIGRARIFGIVAPSDPTSHRNVAQATTAMSQLLPPTAHTLGQAQGVHRLVLRVHSSRCSRGCAGAARSSSSHGCGLLFLEERAGPGKFPRTVRQVIRWEAGTTQNAVPISPEYRGFQTSRNPLILKAFRAMRKSVCPHCAKVSVPTVRPHCPPLSDTTDASLFQGLWWHARPTETRPPSLGTVKPQLVQGLENAPGIPSKPL